MALTSYAQKKLGDHALGIASWTMPTTVYHALFSTSPGAAGSLTGEISGGSYARVSLTSLMGAADATTGIATNTSAITYPAPTAAWGAVQYQGIVDAASGGNVLSYAAIGNPPIVNNGDPALSFGVGAISVSIAGSLAAMITSYLMKKLVDHLLGKSAFTMPTNVYHAMFASDPTIAGTQSSEVGIGGYARQLLAGVMSAVDLSTGTSSNATAVTYPVPTATYPTVNYSGIADAGSGGNLLFTGQLPAALAISNAGAPALFPAGSISLNLA